MNNVVNAGTTKKATGGELIAVATGALTKIITVEFSGRADDVADGAILLREGIGQIKPLRDSLVGKKPKCFGTMGGRYDEHERQRGFKTVDGLDGFIVYMDELVKKAGEVNPNLPAPKFSRLVYRGGHEGFSYRTASRNAEVGFCQRPDGSWEITGWVHMKRPDVVTRNLTAKGFEVSCHEHMCRA